MAAKDRLPRSSDPATRTAKKATPAPVQRISTDKTALTPQNIQTLQRTIGNRAVQRLLAKSEPPTAAPNAMPAEVQGKMENSFQTDFSEVRVHPDSARVSEVGATAFTQGNDIHFAPGAYQPTSDAGQALLGHELSHVVQQRAGRVQPTGTVNGASYNDAPALEREADHSGALAARGETVQMVGQGSTGGGAPVQQHYWGVAAILAAGALLGLSSAVLLPYITAFGTIAVGHYLFYHKGQGTKDLSAEKMGEELEASKGKSDLQTIGGGDKQSSVPESDSAKTPPQDIAAKMPLVGEDELPSGKHISEPESDIAKAPPQDEGAKKAPMGDLPVPREKNGSQPSEDVVKKAPSDVAPKQVQVAETPLVSEVVLNARSKVRRDVIALKQTLTLLTNSDKSEKLAKMLQQIVTLEAIPDDVTLLTKRVIVDQISKQIGPFQVDSDARQLKERQDAEAEQRRITDAARAIHDRYADYRRQMMLAVAQFPDMAEMQSKLVALLQSAAFIPEVDLPTYDIQTVQPEWNTFVAQRAINQLELNSQNGYRIFIYTDDLDTIRLYRATIEQRKNNFNSGRANPFNPGVFHARLAETNVFNENIIYTWQGNNLYLHGLAMWHMDKTMSGDEKGTTSRMEARGGNPANFTEVRYRGGQYVSILP